MTLFPCPRLRKATLMDMQLSSRLRQPAGSPKGGQWLPSQRPAETPLPSERLLLPSVSGITEATIPFMGEVINIHNENGIWTTGLLEETRVPRRLHPPLKPTMEDACKVASIVVADMINEQSITLDKTDVDIAVYAGAYGAYAKYPSTDNHRRFLGRIGASYKFPLTRPSKKFVAILAHLKGYVLSTEFGSGREQTVTHRSSESLSYENVLRAFDRYRLLGTIGYLGHDVFYDGGDGKLLHRLLDFELPPYRQRPFELMARHDLYSNVGASGSRYFRKGIMKLAFRFLLDYELSEDATQQIVSYMESHIDATTDESVIHDYTSRAKIRQDIGALCVQLAKSHPTYKDGRMVKVAQDISSCFPNGTKTYELLTSVEQELRRRPVHAFSAKYYTL